MFQAIYMADAGGSWDNAKKVVELLAPQTEFEEDDITVPESSIKEEKDSNVKAKKIELLDIFKAKAIKH